MVKPFFIRKIRKLRKITNILVLDTEAFIENELEQKFRLAIVFYKNKYYTFTNQNEFLNWFLNLVKTQRKNLYVLGHHLRYDLKLSGLLNLIKQYKIKTYSIQPFFIIVNFNTYRDVIFFDLSNIYNFSLKEIGGFIGIQKLEIGNPNNKEEWNSIPLDQLIKYCKRDVEITYKAFEKLQNWLYNNKLGNIGISLAQIGFNIFRYRFLKNTIIHRHRSKLLNKEFNEIEKLSYRGGRTECFFIGKAKNVNIYDVNSMYPYVMYAYEYPVKRVKRYESVNLETLEKLLNDYCIIAKCYLNIPSDLRFSPIGIKLCKKCLSQYCSHKSYNKLIFPLGKFYAYLTSNEILYCLKNNYLEKVENIFVYEKDYIFKEFVEYFYNLKKNSKKGSIEYLFSKIILNSLYGKFAQQKTIVKPYAYTNNYVDYDYWINENGIKFEQIGNTIFKIIGKKLGVYAFPSISAHITANSRLKLLEYMQIAKDNILYVDTDSLFVYNYKFNDNLVNDNLGNLKLEYENVDIQINAPKDYILYKNGSIIEEKIKGIPKYAEQLYSNYFYYLHLKGFKTMIKDSKNYVEFEKVFKNLKRQVIGIKKEVKNEFLEGYLVYPIILK